MTTSDRNTAKMGVSKSIRLPDGHPRAFTNACAEHLSSPFSNRGRVGSALDHGSTVFAVRYGWASGTQRQHISTPAYGRLVSRNWHAHPQAADALPAYPREVRKRVPAP